MPTAPQATTESSETWARLVETIEPYGSMLVGFSGGVDSALVAIAGTSILGSERCLCVTAVSPSLSEIQFERARALSSHFELNWLTVETSEIDEEGYAANDTSRCYFCKRELWSKLGEIARGRSVAVLSDGTHADDAGEHRPGLTAGTEAGVRSPLAEAGLTKEDIRTELRRLEVPIWDEPSSPCLSSRVLYGLRVNRSRLGQVERGEQLLRDVGITGNLRLRHRGDEARIEIEPDQIPVLRAAADAVSRGLLDSGFRRVTLDHTGYRSGSLLRESGGRIELIAERD